MKGIPLYNKIVCCECSNTYSRFNGGRPEKTNWRCKTRIMKGTPCFGRIVKEAEVKDVVVKAFAALPDHKHSGPITEFNNDDVETYIEKIIVHPGHMEVVFKAGVTVDVEG